jgi:metal-responsive CopG/Arc/MetJ family transcriptional regulator
MKTAISIPDPLFRSAERLAKRLGVPRSRLYADALERYLADREERDTTARLNEIYEKEPAELDPVFAALQWSSLSRETW